MRKLFLLAILVIAVQACDKNDPSPAAGNEHVNSWIYDNMQFWYYWDKDLPASPDKSKDPETFFGSLLSEEDRFSWIQENFTELLGSLRGVNKEAGFEFGLYRESQDNNNVIMQVFYVKSNSPSSSSGLKRGDLITQINGQQITTQNYQELIGKMSESHSLAYKSVDAETKTTSDLKTVNIAPVEYAENPNFLNKVFTYGDRKIGYYVYNLFSEGPDGSSKTYSAEMDNIFSSFKSQGITDLIIDLRFNSGGAESAAQNLASLIVNGVSNTTTFVKHEYNATVTEEIRKDPNLGEGFLQVPFLAKSQNVGSQLRDDRVYVLTGSRTASASELIINGLRPFMDVFLVGGTTVGKNVGSISLYDDEDPSNTWGMQPIVTKLLNNAGQADYTNGFVPQIVDEDNSLYIYPLGDPRETLLNRALVQITGQASISRGTSTKKAGDLLFHSLDAKKRTGVVTVDFPF